MGHLVRPSLSWPQTCFVQVNGCDYKWGHVSRLQEPIIFPSIQKVLCQMPCSHGRLLGEGASWLEPGLVEPGWDFRALACLELADQANVWLYFRPCGTLVLLVM